MSYLPKGTRSNEWWRSLHDLCLYIPADEIPERFFELVKGAQDVGKS